MNPPSRSLFRRRAYRKIASVGLVLSFAASMASGQLGAVLCLGFSAALLHPAFHRHRGPVWLAARTFLSTYTLGMSAILGAIVAALPKSLSSDLGAWDVLTLSGLLVMPPIALLGMIAALGLRWVLDPRPAGTASAPRRCEHCEYDLRGLPTAVCPECGNEAPPPQA